MSALPNPLDSSTSAGSSADDLYWSTELEELHEESSRTHFLDVATMTAVVESLGRISERARIADFGCSSGYLMERLRELVPEERLVGLDFVFAGLKVAQANLPHAGLLRGDACALPFGDASLDAIVSANLLEHVPDDVGALREMFRVLRPGAPAVLVVPAGPRCYDYYDRFLHHQRRYGRGELVNKARTAGLTVRGTFHLGWVIFPAFWLVKKRNRIRRGGLFGDALAAQVAKDIASTNDSTVGHLTRRLETSLRRIGVRPPFGIRELVVLERPASADD